MRGFEERAPSLQTLGLLQIPWELSFEGITATYGVIGVLTERAFNTQNKGVSDSYGFKGGQWQVL